LARLAALSLARLCCILRLSLARAVAVSVSDILGKAEKFLW